MAHDPQDPHDPSEPRYPSEPQLRWPSMAPPVQDAQRVLDAGVPSAPVPPRPDDSSEPQVTPLDTSTAGVPVIAPEPSELVIPPEEVPLDPRRIARESLAAGRNTSLWWVAAGLVVACVVVRVAGGAAGALVLAAILAMSAVVRAVVPEPAPVVLAVRARALDVAVLTGLAVGIGVLSQAIPVR